MIQWVSWLLPGPRHPGHRLLQEHKKDPKNSELPNSSAVLNTLSITSSLSTAEGVPYLYCKFYSLKFPKIEDFSA